MIGAVTPCLVIWYHSPLNWEQLLQFLARRAIPNVELVRDGSYMRTVHIAKEGQNYIGVISVSDNASRHSLSLRLTDSLLPVRDKVVAGVKRLFDVDDVPLRIAGVLGSLAEMHPGLRVPGSLNGFELAVRAILGQRISVLAARTLAGRFAERWGDPFDAPDIPLSRVFPTCQRIIEATPAEIKQLGITGQRADTVVLLANEIATGRLVLDPNSDVEKTMSQLRNIHGIGEWTTQYIAMRALHWPDAFPHTDLGFRRALGENDPRKILAMAETWRPWRAYAAMHLWAAPVATTAFYESTMSHGQN